MPAVDSNVMGGGDVMGMAFTLVLTSFLNFLIYDDLLGEILRILASLGNNATREFRYCQMDTRILFILRPCKGMPSAMNDCPLGQLSKPYVKSLV